MSSGSKNNNNNNKQASLITFQQTNQKHFVVSLFSFLLFYDVIRIILFLYNKMALKKSVSFVAPEKEKETQVFNSYDPIGRHLMALRQFQSDLVDFKKNQSIERSQMPIPTMPQYPKDYPTPEFLKELRRRRYRAKRKLEFKGHFSKKKIDEVRTLSVKRVLCHIGYDAEKSNDDKALDHLSYVTDIFLQKFVERMRFHKDSAAFRESQDLWDPLETTLQEWGFNGVNGIANYFYGEFLKMSEAVHSDCITQLQKLTIHTPSYSNAPE